MLTIQSNTLNILTRRKYNELQQMNERNLLDKYILGNYSLHLGLTETF